MCSPNKCVEAEFVVLKVNGSDISHLSKYEAMQMFLQAEESIIVELFPQKIHDKADPICEQLKKCNITKTEIEASTCVSQNVNSKLLSKSLSSSFMSSIKNQVILTLHNLNKTTEDTGFPSKLNKSQNLISVSKETQTVENYFDLNNEFIADEHHLFEQCLEPEIDIEEITLSREDASETSDIGLSVSCNGIYGKTMSRIKNDMAPNDNIQNACTRIDSFPKNTQNNDSMDVFISAIHPESIAERDGRLRLGDQILRINGRDIKNKEDAETYIAENNLTVTLLVSRVLYPEDEEDDDDEEEYYVDSNFEYENSYLADNYTNVVDKLDKDLLAETTQHAVESRYVHGDEIQTKDVKKSIEPNKSFPHGIVLNNDHCESTFVSSLKEKPTNELSNLLFNHNKSFNSINVYPTTMHRSSSSTDRSKLDYDYDECEHIYETIPEDSESEPLYCSPYQSSTYMTALGSYSSEALDVQQQSRRVAQWLGIKHHSQTSFSTKKGANRTVHTLAGGRPTRHSKSRRSNRISTLRSVVTNASGSSSSGNGITAESENKIDELDNSSSAYNTGGSNNSASNLALGLIKDEVKNSPKEPIVTCLTPSQLNKMHFEKSCASPPINSSQQCDDSGEILLLSRNNTTGNKNNSEINVKLMRIKTSETGHNYHCPQFNAPNLSHYHFVSSQEVAIANKCQTINQNFSISKPSSIFLTNSGSEEIPMVWKVKRRPDGTRYIVKRPARSRAEIQGIRKSIRGAMNFTTTEDDTISEVKIGRYWTKEEKKKHIERARERKLHQLQQQQQ